MRDSVFSRTGTRVFLAALTGLASCVGAPAAADVFTRLTDLRPGTASGVPYLSATVWNGDLYFVGYLANNDSRIFVYDGTNPPSEVAGEGAMVDELVTFGDALVFRGGPFADRELWRWDGVSSPAEVLDLLGSGSSTPELLTVFGNRLCFRAQTALGNEPVCWDGTNAPAEFDVNPGTGGSNPEEFAVIGGALYFSGYEDVHGTEGRVYTSTGDPSLYADLRPGTPSASPRDWSALGPDLWFSASDDAGQGRLWRQEPGFAPAMHPYGLDVEGGVFAHGGAVFAAGHDDGGGSPYVYRFADPLVTRLQPSVAFADDFVPLAGALYFAAGATSPGTDLYRWCGDESVELVSTGFASPNDAIVHGLLVHDGRLFFAAKNGLTTGSELWQLEPSEAIFCSGFLAGDDSEWSAVAP